MTLSWLPGLLFTTACLLLIVTLFYAGRRFFAGDRAVPPGVDLPLLGFIAIIGAVIVVGSFATLLAVIGLFFLPLLSLLTGAVALLLAIWLWRHPRQGARGALAAGGWQEVGLGMLLVVAALLYFRPHEYVLGGHDAGSYVNTAIGIARTGNIVTSDEWLAFLGEYADVTLRQHPAQWQPRYLQFVGWYIDDEQPSRMVPQFFPFHPALLAIGAAIAGPLGALYLTPLWGVLDIAALYFLARYLFGKPVALLASLVLTVTATQIYFARYPTTEPLTMLLLFTALLAFQVAWDEPQASPGWGVLGGSALGAALLTRIDLPVVLGLFLLGMLVRWWQRRWSRVWTAFLTILGLYLLQLVWNVWQINWPYFYNTYTVVFALLRTDLTVLIGAGALLVLVLVAATWLRPAGLVHRVGNAMNHRLFRWSAAIIVVALSAYAYFLRPQLEPARYIQSWPANSSFPILNGQNWLRMGWYLTPWGLFLATAGLASLLVRGALPRLSVVLGIGALTTIQYVYNILNAHYQIYAMRRYVPIVIPMLLMFAAVAICSFPRLRRRWITWTLQAAAILALVGGIAYQSRFVVAQTDYSEITTALSSLAQMLDPEAIVLFAETEATNFADTFGPPLYFAYGHPVATLRADGARAAAFMQDLEAYAAQSGRPVQLLAVEPVLDTLRQSVHLQPRTQYTVTSTVLMGVFDAFPSAIQPIQYGIEIYDVLARTGEAAASEPLLIDVGGMDAAYIGEGFHSKEYLPGASSMRWTKERAAVSIPAAIWGEAQRAVVEVSAMIYRPEALPAQPVQVLLEDALVGEFTPTDSWQTYTFVITRAMTTTATTPILTFVSPTFVPAELGSGGDQRQLGFLIDWIRIFPQAINRSLSEHGAD